MALDERMLSSEGVFSEGVAEKSTDPGMEFGVVGSHQIIYLVIRG